MGFNPVLVFGLIDRLIAGGVGRQDAAALRALVAEVERQREEIDALKAAAKDLSQRVKDLDRMVRARIAPR
jgi:cell division protein FtsB